MELCKVHWSRDGLDKSGSKRAALILFGELEKHKSLGVKLRTVDGLQGDVILSWDNNVNEARNAISIGPYRIAYRPSSTGSDWDITDSIAAITFVAEVLDDADYLMALDGLVQYVSYISSKEDIPLVHRSNLDWYSKRLSTLDLNRLTLKEES